MPKTPAKPQSRAANAKRQPTKAAPQSPAEPQIVGKLGLIVGLLRRPQGADLGDLMEATGWQEHSIRGALAGALKQKHGLYVVSEKPANVRIYRLPAPPTSVSKPARAPSQPAVEQTKAVAKPAAKAKALAPSTISPAKRAAPPPAKPSPAKARLTPASKPPVPKQAAPAPRGGSRARR